MSIGDPHDAQPSSNESPQHAIQRRDFLKGAGAVPVAVAAAQVAKAAPAAAEKKMPHIQIGKYSFSRLICGNNTFAGGSHLSVFVNHELRSYYTPEQVLRTLRHCEEVGINTWQAGGTELYERHRAEGGKLQFLSIATNGFDKLAKGGCIGVAHHGEATDRYFKDGKFDKVHDALKRIRDTGMLVGCSTHMPDVVDAIESKGWDLDYYMTCIYERHRSEKDLLKLLGHVPLPVGEVYLKSDPPRMFKMIQQTKRPCLAFKILAAGRLSERRELVEQAFRDTFAAIKPTDGVIVGIYDRYTDQIAEDAALTCRYGSRS